MHVELSRIHRYPAPLRLELSAIYHEMTFRLLKRCGQSLQISNDCYKERLGRPKFFLQVLSSADSYDLCFEDCFINKCSLMFLPNKSDPHGKILQLF